MSQEDKLWRLLRVSKPDTFWRGQKMRVLERIAEKPSPRILWRLSPVFVAAALLIMLQFRRRASPAPEPVPSSGEWGLLQNLDLLEDMDKTLEAQHGRL